MIDLVTLLASVGTLRKLVHEVSGLAGDIRGGMFGNADRVKDELAGKVQELDETMKQVGQLATVARAYLATHNNVVETLSLTRRAERVLRESMDDLRTGQGAVAEAAWRLVESIFDSIDESRDTAIKVMYDRQSWYDPQDRAQLDALFNESTLSFERARTGVRNRYAGDLNFHVQAMADQLLKAETLLRSTIDEKILATSQGLTA